MPVLLCAEGDSMFESYHNRVLSKVSLTRQESYDAMKHIFDGYVSDVKIASFLTALNMKEESIDEIVGFASCMRDNALRINPKVNLMVDTCGTGGDKVKTINVSTAVAIIVSSCGLPVAKHGNRAVTSKAGSADVLEALGLNLNQDPDQIERSIEEVGIGFMFAPHFHPSMKRVADIRKELGIKTVFNILGPLTNPANANIQLLGVFSEDLTHKIANVLSFLGCERGLVVHGTAGLDEISNIGETVICEINSGELDSYKTTPADFGINEARISDILGGNSMENANFIIDLLKGVEKGPKKDIVLMNASGALYAAGYAKDFKEGVEIANQAIEDNSAFKKLLEFIEFSGGDLNKLKNFGVDI